MENNRSRLLDRINKRERGITLIALVVTIMEIMSYEKKNKELTLIPKYVNVNKNKKIVKTLLFSYFLSLGYIFISKAF